MKKVSIYILIISMMNLVGCYYQEQISPSTYDFEEHADIQLTTNDTTYILKGKDYTFKNDTLFATVSKKIDKQTTLKTNTEIPLRYIERIEVERTDVLATTFTIIGVLVGSFVVFAALAFAVGGVF